MKLFGDKLRMIRKNFHLTQADLAQKVGVSTSTIGMYEQNRREPNFKILRKICDIFSVQADDLIENSKNKIDMIEASKKFIETINNSDLRIKGNKASQYQIQTSRKIIISSVERAIKEIYMIFLNED